MQTQIPLDHFVRLPLPLLSSLPSPTPNINNSAVILVHSLDKVVDEKLAVAMVTPLNVVPGLLPVSSTSIAQLERPQKVVGFLEVWANCDNLVDQIFNTDDAIFAQSLFKPKSTINSRQELETSVHKQCDSAVHTPHSSKCASGSTEWKTEPMHFLPYTKTTTQHNLVIRKWPLMELAMD